MEKELYANIYQVEKTHWWYAARREITFDWVFSILRGKSSPLILDIGCGTGFNIEFLKVHGYSNVLGIDVSDDALTYCRGRGLKNILGGDVQALPFKEASFDLICALDILEHVENDLLGLSEIQRILKPGGTLVIFTPAFQFLWSLQDEISHHFRRYTARELKKKILSVGFALNKLTYTNTFLFPIIWLGRFILRFLRKHVDVSSENDINPKWSNGILRFIFQAEKSVLHYIDFPFGVSLLCICTVVDKDIKCV